MSEKETGCAGPCGLSLKRGRAFSARCRARPVRGGEREKAAIEVAPSVVFGCDCPGNAR